MANEIVAVGLGYLLGSIPSAYTFTLAGQTELISLSRQVRDIVDF
jgi:glycerol-3-phosphate acyltransferase PlsY